MRPSGELTEQGLALALQGIEVRFGGLVALEDVSLQVTPGRIIGVIGPNGAGKTTLFNVVCGFVRPTAGTMTLNGVPLRPRPHQLSRLGISRTLQGVGLFNGMTVLENVVAGATHTATAGFWSALLGLPRSDNDERRLKAEAMALLDEMGCRQVRRRVSGDAALRAAQARGAGPGVGRQTPAAAARRAGRWSVS